MTGATVEIRGYEARDLEACRALWVELTVWHREIYGNPGIGGAEPGVSVLRVPIDPEAAQRFRTAHHAAVRAAVAPTPTPK